MSSSLYLGPPGVGKTTALVRYVILPALKRGQRVVTNVPLNEAAIVDYLGCNLDGLIRLVSSEEINRPDFWFTETDKFKQTITQPGDCICIDEAHEFYGSDKRIKSDHPVFRAVRLQRKYTGGTGNFSTHIVFATQLYSDICKSLRGVCDSMYYMQKLTVVGKPDSYRVDIYADCRKPPERARPVSSMFGTYDPEYFALYNSYSTGVGGFSSDAPGVETVSDDRLNIWNSRIGIGPFKLTLQQSKYIAIAVCVLSFIGLFWGFYVALSPSEIKERTTPVSVDSAPPPAVPAVPAAPVPGSSAFEATKLSEPAALVDSKDFRLVGFYQIGGVQIAVVADSQGAYRYLVAGPFSSTDYQLIQAGPGTHIVYRNQIIAPWTGPRPRFGGFLGSGLTESSR